MFQGRRVEDQRRFEVRNHIFNASLVANASENGFPGKIRAPFAEFHFNLVQMVLGAIEQNYLGWIQIGNLADQFTADGTACAGNQYTLTGDEHFHCVPVQDCFGAAEQIGDFDWSCLGSFLDACLQLGKPRESRHR